MKAGYPVNGKKRVTKEGADYFMKQRTLVIISVAALLLIILIFVLILQDRNTGRRGLSGRDGVDIYDTHDPFGTWRQAH